MEPPLTISVHMKTLFCLLGHSEVTHCYVSSSKNHLASGIWLVVRSVATWTKLRKTLDLVRTLLNPSRYFSWKKNSETIGNIFTGYTACMHYFCLVKDSLLSFNIYIQGNTWWSTLCNLAVTFYLVKPSKFL